MSIVVARATVKAVNALPGSMVGPGRLELPTLRLSGVRSNHLSYRPSCSTALSGDAPQETHTRNPAKWSPGDPGARDQAHDLDGHEQRKEKRRRRCPASFIYLRTTE